MLIVWQMESHSDVIGKCCCHCGRWNNHMDEIILLWQMLLPLWQMDQPLSQMFILFYFILSSEILD